VGWVAEQPAPGFGPLLRRLRADAGLTQEELADTARVSPRTVSDLERGTSTTARGSTARLLADALGLAGSQRRMFEEAARGRAVIVDADGSAAVGAGRAGDFQPVARRMLPRDVTAFTGRAAELQWLAARAVEPGRGGVVQICAIGGMAGIGKTALSVHAAHQLAPGFPDGQYFVPLHGHTPGHRPADPGDVLADLLRTVVGLPGPQIPAGLDARAACWRDYLAGKKTLLVLDDAAGHDQVRPLLPGTAGGLVLVTSRRRLTALDDAAVIELDALPPADAAGLLVRLAARPDVDGGDQAVGQITRVCAYLPLAIAMLAGQLRHHPSWTPASLAADLSAARSRMDLMRAEKLSVAAAFDVSYRSLTPRQRRLFRRLGLQLGPEVDAYAAAALDGTPLPAARRGLEALYDRHLVTEPAPGRYGLHDLLRAHAQALAAADDPAACEAATTRLLNYYVHTARAAGRRQRGAPANGQEAPGHPPEHSPALATPGEAAAWLAAERANLQAAAVSGRRVPEYLISAVFAGVEDAWGGDQWEQVLAQYQEILAVAVREGDQAGQARALWLVAQARLRNGDLAGAISAAERAAALFLSVGDRAGHANAVGWVGWLHGVTGDQVTARTLLNRAVTLFSGLGYQRGHGGALANLGVAQLVTGDYPAAAASVRAALELARGAGDRSGQEGALYYLAQVQRVTGDLESALVSVREALELNRDTGDRVMHAYALGELAAVQRLSGDGSAAAASISEASQEWADMWADIGRLGGQARALNELGQLQAQTGDYQAAAQAYRRALQLFADGGVQAWERSEVIINLGEVESETGATTQAREHFNQALALARRHTMPLEEARALEGLGRSHLHDHNRSDAVTFLRQALAIYQRIGAPNAQCVQRTVNELASETGSGTPPASMNG
jgi:tetratricopeptide (TPR) repeat protein/transcriptional regulator with XRE-family HTH domain